MSTIQLIRIPLSLSEEMVSHKPYEDSSYAQNLANTAQHFEINDKGFFGEPGDSRNVWILKTENPMQTAMDFSMKLEKETMMTTIKYKFQEAFLTPNPLELEKTRATITSDGKVTVSYYKGTRRTVKRIISVNPIDVENLITEMKKYERPIVFMDAVICTAKITFDHGETMTFNPAPWCLVEFVNKLMEANA